MRLFIHIETFRYCFETNQPLKIMGGISNGKTKKANVHNATIFK